MTDELKKGDKVSWESSGGHSVGKVVKKQTTPTQIKGHKVAASKDNPEFIVKSDKSGKQAAHKGEALKKMSAEQSKSFDRAAVQLPLWVTLGLVVADRRNRRDALAIPGLISTKKAGSSMVVAQFGKAGVVVSTVMFGALADMAGAEEQDDRLTLDEKGVTVRLLEGRAELNLGGRLYLDLGSGDVSNDAYDIFDHHVDFSQARIELTGTFEDRLTAVYQYDLTDDEAPLKDVALALAFEPLVATAGNVKEPFSLEELISDNDITFMERSLANAFSPGRGVGAAIAAADDRWTAAAGLFGGNMNDSVDEAGLGVTGRVTYAPMRQGDDVIHLGTSISYRDLNSGEVSFSTSPESYLFDASLVDTGTIEDASDLASVGLEAAWQQGSARVQGEYVLTQVNRDRGEGDLSFHGGYLLAAWVINGSGRPYSTDAPDYGAELGAFEGVGLADPQRISQGGIGVFELAARVSAIDLADKDVQGGRQGNLTVGLNWYPDKNFRLMANYVRAEADDAPEAGRDVSADIIQFRIQAAF